MDISLDLFGNAVISGLLLGGFYAAVTIGITISFGMLDVVNIAHPAFIILGSYIAYFANSTLGVDPILASVVVAPAFYALGAAIYQVYYLAFERHGDKPLQGLAFFFGLLFITEVTLVLVFGVDYRLVEAPYIGPSLHLGPIELPGRLLVPCLVALAMVGALHLFTARTFIGRAILAVAQDQLALRLMAADPVRIKRIAFGLLAAAAVFIAARLIGNPYVFFAGYVVLQYIVLSTAWNILGGYTGYVNFGTPAFLAIGAYASVALYKIVPLPIPLLMLVGGVLSGVVGLGTGYLTLRLRGVFFSIATLAMSVVVQTLVTNWDFVGGSRGAYIIRPMTAPLIGGGYIDYLCLVMLALAVASIVIARAIERSKLGIGFATIRDDEAAAEASGVPTLRLKLLATTLSGALMGMAGAPLPYYVTYLDPASGFSTVQQLVTVTISSAANLLIVGLILVGFVVLAPNGIVGLVRGRR